MMKYRPTMLTAALVVTLLTQSACSTHGELLYLTPAGEQKTACATEYSGAPAVDRYAVEYVLASCAREAAARGYQVVDPTLLQLDLAVAAPPAGQRWSFELATLQHRRGLLSDKEYGYLIGWLDLKHDVKGQPAANRSDFAQHDDNALPADGK